MLGQGRSSYDSRNPCKRKRDERNRAAPRRAAPGKGEPSRNCKVFRHQCAEKAAQHFRQTPLAQLLDYQHFD